MFAAVVVVCLKVSTPGVPVECRIRHRVFDTERACVTFVDRLRLQAIPERFAVDMSCMPFNRQV